MLNFIRDYYRIILKLLSNQFGATFLAILLGMASSKSDSALFFCTSIFSILFFFYLNYTLLWDEGAKDRIRVDGNRKRYDSLTGLWLGIAAAVPNLILGITASGTYIFAAENGPFAWEWAGIVSGYCSAIARLWQGMYLGILKYTAPSSPFALLIIPLPAILICFIAYRLGFRKHRLFSGFLQKKNDKDKNEK